MFSVVVVVLITFRIIISERIIVEDEDVLHDRARCSPEAREKLYHVWMEIMSKPINQKAFAEQLFAKIIEDNAGSNYLLRKPKQTKVEIAWRLLAAVDALVVGLRSDNHVSYFIDSVKAAFGKTLNKFDESLVMRFADSLRWVMKMASHKNRRITSHIYDCVQILYSELKN